jgi:hypothetical protein
MAGTWAIPLPARAAAGRHAGRHRAPRRLAPPHRHPRLCRPRPGALAAALAGVRVGGARRGGRDRRHVRQRARPRHAAARSRSRRRRGARSARRSRRHRLLEEGSAAARCSSRSGVSPAARFWIANAATSAVYATAHFARGGGRPRDDRLGERLAGLGRDRAGGRPALRGLDRPVRHRRALLRPRLAAGARLGRGRGLHAGAVLALQVGGELTEAAHGNRSLFLVDGLLPGYAIAALAAAAAVGSGAAASARG